MMPNEAERRRWNDQRWTASWPERERLTSAVTPLLIAALALRPGDRVLDVGTGGGASAIAAASVVAPGGSVTGVDLSTALLDLARRRAADAGVENASFHVADAQTDRVDGTPFDVASSQFGVMFFDEPAVAFANIRAQLRPGGRLVFACWRTVDRNPWHTGAVLSAFVPPPPRPAQGKSQPGPFRLGDVATTTAILEAAGFAEVGHTSHDLVTEAPARAVVDEQQLEFLGVAPGQLAEARAALDTHLSRFRVAADRYEFPLSFLIFRCANAVP